jgi:hypothetical protein
MQLQHGLQELPTKQHLAVRAPCAAATCVLCFRLLRNAAVKRLDSLTLALVDCELVRPCWLPLVAGDCLQQRSGMAGHQHHHERHRCAAHAPANSSSAHTVAAAVAAGQTTYMLVGLVEAGLSCASSCTQPRHTAAELAAAA